MNTDKQFYEIACSFPVMRNNGVEKGYIPGIKPDRFCADTLSKFHSEIAGLWSSGEVLVLECLLNLYNPGTYPVFNLGYAANVWDSTHMLACLRAVSRVYNGK